MQSLQLIINISSKKFSTNYEIKVVDKALKIYKTVRIFKKSLAQTLEADSQCPGLLWYWNVYT